MPPTRLTGVDVSQHQGSVEWHKVANAGFDFAIVKTSEGQDFIDPSDGPVNAPNEERLRRLRARVAAIRQQHMTLGVYHFLRPRPSRTGDVEADWAVRVARKVGWGKPGDMRLFLDVEVTDIGSRTATHRYIGQFVKRAKELTGHRPVIYTFPNFWNVLGNPSVFRCPLWVAHFEVNQPSIPAPWTEFAIWQHSSKGSVPGIAGHVDLNKATRVPVIDEAEPVPAEPAETPEPVLTQRERLIRRMRRARQVFAATGSNEALRVMLICKARLGRWDDRYCLFFGPPTDVSDDVKRFITRGYASGLVPTFTTNGQHSAGSFHAQHRAADIGLRSELVGTQKGLKRMERFQRAEFNRRAKTHPVELIGPINDNIILGGGVSPLGEGTPLEDQHDNHVHGAF
jgi:GH25 family lysozyme M1 (1,4-beta-N-acetylmuramidase)